MTSNLNISLSSGLRISKQIPILWMAKREIILSRWGNLTLWTLLSNIFNRTLFLHEAQYFRLRTILLCPILLFVCYASLSISLFYYRLISTLGEKRKNLCTEDNIQDLSENNGNWGHPRRILPAVHRSMTEKDGKVH